jgi:hypothetical protein
LIDRTRPSADDVVGARVLSDEVRDPAADGFPVSVGDLVDAIEKEESPSFLEG